MIRVLYLLFVLSGAAGLIYESIWTRYLGLFVGHDAYAQILVLVIFLGGMSIGAMVVSGRSARLKEPLYGYVAVEFLVGVIGLLFHDAFGAITNYAYTHLYPALAGGLGQSVAKWGIASLLILPQSLLLGATFPLMTAGVLRLAREQPGRQLAMLYFANSLGAAGGVLVAGFYLVNLAGLPGTLLVAAMLNLLVALLTIVVNVRARNDAVDAAETAAAAPAPPAPPPLPILPAGLNAVQLRRLLLFTSFGTAIASFIYEIDWIRMLSLVLGSATHSFELMLSAFILGLALGSLWIRSRIDRLTDPIRTLGLVQWTMGLLALATLPLYAQSFQWIVSLIATFARTDGGYAGFTMARYAICLVVMLPATFCAGMTLPLITRTLMVSGEGERAIGAVYGWNTFGSIVGVVLGALVLLPALGLKGMLLAGAIADVGIGVLLLRVAGRTPGTRRLALVAAAAGVTLIAAIGALTPLEQRVLISGAYRTGTIAASKWWDIRSYHDGRTATVGTVRDVRTGGLTISTNGKPDASLSPAWYQRCDSVRRRQPLVADAATQLLLPMITAAHAPHARRAAVIGQGSGMSSHFLLASRTIKQVVTVEIEPQMIAGSRIFLPANHRTFDDPRSTIVIDDAKSYFASSQQRYDLILSEPSNPWVSGVSGLFTAEFYQRVQTYLTPDGVFGQWLHLYELDDALVLSVLAAIHRAFASYEVYLAPSGDLLIVASNRPTLPKPDWSVFSEPALVHDLCRFVQPTPSQLDGLHLVSRRELAPVLDHYAQPNSDYYPVLDLGAERQRYLHELAGGFSGLSSGWFNLLGSLSGTRLGVDTSVSMPFPENPRLMARAIGAFLRGAMDTAQIDTIVGGVPQQAAYRWLSWQASMAADKTPSDWRIWVQLAGEVDHDRNSGTAGWADSAFYAGLDAFMTRHAAPAAVRDVVAFRHGMAAWNFREASNAADRLLPVAIASRTWIGPDELRDGAVFAALHLREPARARKYLDLLGTYTTRRRDDLRNRLLDSYVRALEETGPQTALR